MFICCHPLVVFLIVMVISLEERLAVLSLESGLKSTYLMSGREDPHETLARALECVAQAGGYGTVAFYRPMRVSPGQLIAHTRSPVLVPSVSVGTDAGLAHRILPRSTSVVRKAYDGRGEATGGKALALPVEGREGRQYGVLYVTLASAQERQARELQKALARHATKELGLWNDFFHERDSQTGTLSGIQLARDMPLYIRDAVETGGELGVLYFDGNRLKAINSRFGRDTGTDWITLIGKGLAAAVGDDASLYRRGDSSDEFVLVLPHHSKEQAARYEPTLLRRVIGYIRGNAQGTRVAQLPDRTLRKYLEAPYASTAIELHDFLSSPDTPQWARRRGVDLETTTDAGLGRSFLMYGDDMVQRRKRELGVRR